ncbi:uncharacterized protein LOC134275560 [Saccostrea cucullata]|uniref:uncharacterized protein LOC134275560 n=1 Tax=Saccostrea cuccullata TaxID=36930 RepID=UPI002ED1AB7C
MPKSYKCAVCGRAHLKQRRPIKTKPLKRFVTKLINREIQCDDVICDKCRAVYRKTVVKSRATQKRATLIEGVISDDEDADFIVNIENTTSEVLRSPKNITLHVQSTASSHKYCVICKEHLTKGRKSCIVPLSARTQSFIEKGIFIDSQARCCVIHLTNKIFSEEALKLIKSKYSKTSFNRTDIVTLLENVRKTLTHSSGVNFEHLHLLSDSVCYSLTGLNKQHFEDVVSHLTTLKNSSVRTIKTCVAILLTKLRTGLPNHLLGVIFSLTKSQIQRCVHSARSCLMQEFVPQHIGFHHISHADFVSQHTTPISKRLFSNNNDDAAIIVLDGTYIYIQKSSDYTFQRMSFSMYKHRPLLKPMVIVGTDGYILSILGPYYAKNNDTSITKHILKTNSEGMKVWLNDNDIFIVDRGFRDVSAYLKEEGFNVEMPHYLQKGNKQHNTEEANTSRLVTKVRWVVESVNSRIKQWKFFDKVVSNHYIPYIGDFLRIVCSLFNCYRPQLANMDPSSEELANKMLERSSQRNDVQRMVEEEGLLKKRSIFKKVEMSTCTSDNSLPVQDFPVLSMDKLREITLGIYQLKEAKNYVIDNFSEDQYEVYVCNPIENLLRVKLKSRHSGSVRHTVFIHYNLDEIIGWYCTCKVGARVVGCCAHVASVLWYLGYHRFQGTDFQRVKFHSSITDASIPPETDSEMESWSDDNPMLNCNSY